jgi:multiple sugar transport system substrate-binding protein
VDKRLLDLDAIPPQPARPKGGDRAAASRVTRATAAPPATLTALAWDHPRCLAPMRACAAAWLERTGVEVVWAARSLAAFGDEPLDSLAREYDLLVIDHPMCGAAAETGSLLPLDGLLAPRELAELAAASAGPSHRSYVHAGHQWAVATDAACQVAAYRDDLLEAVPRTWKQVLELAREGRVALPLAPAHAISSLLSLCAAADRSLATGPRLVQPAIGEWALSMLAEVAALGPREALGWEPPDLLGWMRNCDEIAYCPLTYGYVTYCPEVRFARVPGGCGSVLGGAGLAVSAHSKRPDAAAEFAAWVAGPHAQTTIVARTGGQPAARAAWTEPGAGDFYSATLSTLETAWIRPRGAWWPEFQLAAGEALTRGLAAGAAPGALLAELETIYESRRRLR